MWSLGGSGAEFVEKVLQILLQLSLYGYGLSSFTKAIPILYFTDEAQRDEVNFQKLNSQ